MKISKKEFDTHARNNNFIDGPHIEAIAYNAPYQPYRHLKGTLRTGIEVESSTDPNWMKFTTITCPHCNKEIEIENLHTS